MRILHIVMLIMVCLPACKRQEAIAMDDLYGKWDIVKAKRNGKETNYLRGGYFVINNDGRMTVNITGEEEQGSYTLDGRRLQFGQDKTFSIETLSADSLTVTFTAPSNGQFIFYMARPRQETQ